MRMIMAKISSSKLINIEGEKAVAPKKKLITEIIIKITVLSELNKFFIYIKFLSKYK
jgi:hypothetical protein